MKVLVDTSFLIFCVESGRDFISLAEEKMKEPFECYILEDILNELKAIQGRGGRKGAMASLALKIAENMKKLSGGENLPVDEKLIRKAKKIGAAIASIDLQLVKKARKRGVPVLSIGSDQRVIFEGFRL